MAHFAQLDENDIVINVCVVDNADIIDGNGDEDESLGIALLKGILGSDTKWKQTSYNGSLRKNFAGIGYQYNNILDAFIAPKPFDSWILNTLGCYYEAPAKLPDSDNLYDWDEDSRQWVIHENND